MAYRERQDDCGCKKPSRKKRCPKKERCPEEEEDCCPKRKCCPTQLSCGTTFLDWQDACGNCYRATIQSDPDPSAFLRTTQQLAAALQAALNAGITNPAALAAALTSLGIYNGYSTSTFIGVGPIPSQTSLGAQIIPNLVTLFTTLITAFPPLTPITVQVTGAPIGGGLASLTTVISYSSAAGPVILSSSALARINDCGNAYPTIVNSTSTLVAPF